MQLISNNQSSLEKLFKSRNAIIGLLTATSLLQSLHTTLVIRHLTFIKDDFWAWAHSFLLSLCVELYIIVFSIRSNHNLAILYLGFTILINIGMAYIAHGFSFNFFFYALITTIFPLSVYYTALELAKKQYEHRVVEKAESSPAAPKVKRKYNKRKKTNTTPPVQDAAAE
jgi:hypothetical protein